ESFFIMNREAKSVSYKVKRKISDQQYQLEKTVDAEEYSAFNAILKHVEPRLFRCISISEDAEEGIYTIVAVKHNPQKEAIVDEAAEYVEPNHSIINTLPQLVNGHTSNNGREIILKWDSLEVAGKQNEYRIELLKDQALYKTYRTKENQLVLTNLPQGEYVAKVRAINSAGQFSEELIIAFSTTYKIDGLHARPIVFGIELHWQLPALITTEAYTEIWYSDVDDRTKTSKLAVLPYPQSSYTLNGLSVGDELFFWFRLVDADGNQGKFSYTLKGRTSDSADDILGYLQDQITTKEINSDAVDEIIEQAKKNIYFDDVVTAEDVDKIIEQSLENTKEKVDEIIAGSDTVNSLNQKTENSELDSKLLELSKITADRTIYSETQTNRVSIDKNYAEMILQKISEVTNSKQLASQYLSLVVQNEMAKAEFLLSQIAQATTDNAFAREIHSLTASFLENEASIKSLKETVTNEFESTARSIEKMHSEFSDDANRFNADLILSKMAQATGDAQLAQQYLSLLVQNEKAKAELILSQLAQTTSDKAIVHEITSLSASFLDNSASVNEMKEAVADIDGNVKSQYTLTTEAIKNGKKVVSGFTSVNDGETSEFLIQADKFAIVNLKNGQIVMPFIIANGKLIFDGDMIGTGTVSGNKLVAGTSIQAPIMKGGRIESGHFAGGSINIGNGNFNVDSKGNLYAKSGRFEGTVYADKIEGDIATFYTMDKPGTLVIPPAKFERELVFYSTTMKGGSFPSGNKNRASPGRVRIYVDGNLKHTTSTLYATNAIPNIGINGFGGVFVAGYFYSFIEFSTHIAYSFTIPPHTSPTVEIRVENGAYIEGKINMLASRVGRH
ncbi:MAG TPA: DUF1983 domain-containing protein, partial [Erysipelothrix sp.]